MSSNPAKSPHEEGVPRDARLITIDGSFDGESTGVRPKVPNTAGQSGSLAPTAAVGRPVARALTPWLAALAGSLVTAAGFILAGSLQPPSQVSPASAPLVEKAEPVSEPAAMQHPFQREVAEQTAAIALKNARSCGVGPGTAISLTFADDGSVQRIDARRTGGLDSGAGACMEEHLAGVRIPAFEGKPAVVRLVARQDDHR
jgi:hypothetical protein